MAFFICVFLYVAYRIIKYSKENEYYVWNLLTLQYSVSLNDERRSILEKEFPYYIKLNATDKEEFRKRVQHFILNKQFESVDSIAITEEMKVMIAATAVQILFKRKAYYLSMFDTILISENFPVQLNKLHSKKQIQISWTDFEQGYKSITDGYNPGIKIMAMALDLEHQFGENSLFSESTYKDFNRLYKQEAEKYIMSGKSKYDNYNKVDRSEYFAVAVEYFFERPEHFQANQPAMYLALSKLLRQDSLGIYKYKVKFFN
jgi:Mlc titration factor MtfA (ptsG expression regulator)